MTESATVTVRIGSYWRVGTGRGASGRLDALCVRDPDGLPYLPGRSLKGLLRDAVHRAEQWGWYDDLRFEPDLRQSLTDYLFGEPGFRELESGTLEPVRAPASGCLQIGNAMMPASDRACLRADMTLIQHLFLAVNSTAIEQETGAPQHQTLRAEEVAVPMTLAADITASNQKLPAWPRLLRCAAPLIRAVGSGKSRGLGRCQVLIGGEQP